MTVDAPPSTRHPFRDDRRGSVTILCAVLLPVLIGMVALVAEFGHGLLIRTENQRLADLAAYAGAVAYGPSSSTSAMNAAIANVAVLNGVPSSSVAGTLVASPSGNGNQAVSVTVSTSKLLLLAPVLGTGSQLAVSAGAFAEVSAEGSACVMALSGAQTGITLSGGTQLNVPGCGVASNTTVTVPCGTAVTTKFVNYDSATAPSQPCNGIQPPAGTSTVRITRKVTADPLAGHAGKTAAVARLATVNGYAAPAAPTVTAPTGGTHIEFAWDRTGTQSQATAAGCTAAWANNTSTWTLTCPDGSTRNFGNITIGGGIKLNFNTAGLASNVYNFSGSITNGSGATMTFGPGTYNIAGNIIAGGTATTFAAGNYNVAGRIDASNGTIAFGAGNFNVAQGIFTGGGTTTTFGAGTFNVGPGPASPACNGSERFSICHKGTTLTFGGPSTFVLSAGLYNNGGSTVTFGSGTTNVYQFGPSLGTGGGNAFYLGGGSKTKLADTNSGTDVFRIVGHVNTAAGGGSCLTLPVAAQHDIKGNLLTAGGTRLGAGTYTVTGYVALGGSGGGDVSCDGATVGMIGSAVTLVVGGAATPSSGSCSGRSFCIGAGYNTVTLTAPTTGTAANFVVIGPTSAANAAGALFTAGAGGTSLSGAFYFPYGPVELSGGASVGNGAGQCLELIGSRITLSGGTALASRCIGGGSATSTAKLVR